MGIDAGGFEPLKLSVNCPPEQRSLETRCVGGGHDRLVDLVQQPGDRWEKVWLEDSQIFDDSKRGPRVVANPSSPTQCNQFGGSLRCNEHWKVANGGPNVTS